jgi:prepilin-type N-terminal cleavage/methylation domain-containing protein
MMHYRRQRGFTLLELSVTVFVLGLMVYATARLLMDKYIEGKLESTIIEAKALANIADGYRQASSGTSINSDGVYEHQYPILPPDSSVSQFNAAYGVSIGRGDASAFGTNYRINMSNRTTWVTVRVPFPVTSPLGVAVVPVGAETDVVAYATRRVSASQLLQRAQIDKQSLYSEERR